MRDFNTYPQETQDQISEMVDILAGKVEALKPEHGRWIPGYAGRYSITEDGHVYSVVCTDTPIEIGPWSRCGKGERLDANTLFLTDWRGDKKLYTLGALLLMTFIGPAEGRRARKICKGGLSHVSNYHWV